MPHVLLIKTDIVFIGSHGCSKKNDDKKLFFEDLRYMADTIKPKVICVYGKVNNETFESLKKSGIKIISYESEFSLTHEVN